MESVGIGVFIGSLIFPPQPVKNVKIIGGGKEAIAILDWNNRLTEPCPTFGLNIGDDLSIHYRNHSEEYKYENIPVYTKLYHPQEIMDYMIAKNTKMNKLIETFDLVLSV